jgi:hypothetical protein
VREFAAPVVMIIERPGWRRRLDASEPAIDRPTLRRSLPKCTSSP